MGGGCGVRRYISDLTPSTEFAVVIIAAFGMFMWASLEAAYQLLSPAPVTGSVPALDVAQFSAADLWGLVLHELLVLALLAPFLQARGWDLRRIIVPPAGVDFVYAAALTKADDFIYTAAWIVLSVTIPGLATTAQSGGVAATGLDLTSVIAVSVVNGIFEELLVTGYIISFLKDRAGIHMAINVSVAIRLLYHLYQGVVGVIAIIPMGLIFAYWYARGGSLWALIIAHIFLDIIGLMGLMAATAS
jgi:membrane protease YdiL (CAAX protease family)